LVVEVVDPGFTHCSEQATAEEKQSVQAAQQHKRGYQQYSIRTPITDAPGCVLLYAWLGHRAYAISKTGTDPGHTQDRMRCEDRGGGPLIWEGETECCEGSLKDPVNREVRKRAPRALTSLPESRKIA
jgi:hypothetical protein